MSREKLTRILFFKIDIKRMSVMTTWSPNTKYGLKPCQLSLNPTNIDPSSLDIFINVDILRFRHNAGTGGSPAMECWQI